MCGIDQDIESESVYEGTGADTGIISTSKTQQLNGWEFGLEIYLLVSEECWKKIQTLITIGNRRSLYVILEGRPAICHWCNRKGHLQSRCPTCPEKQKYEYTEAAEKSVMKSKMEKGMEIMNETDVKTAEESTTEREEVVAKPP